MTFGFSNMESRVTWGSVVSCAGGGKILIQWLVITQRLEGTLPETVSTYALHASSGGFFTSKGSE